eukprot:7012241-Pyramimonas_sp.AAC.1
MMRMMRMALALLRNGSSAVFEHNEALHGGALSLLSSQMRSSPAAHLQLRNNTARGKVRLDAIGPRGEHIPPSLASLGPRAARVSLDPFVSFAPLFTLLVHS